VSSWVHAGTREGCCPRQLFGAMAVLPAMPGYVPLGKLSRLELNGNTNDDAANAAVLVARGEPDVAHSFLLT